MSEFMNNDFLLDTKTARVLYHEYAEGLPIFDFHNHLSSKDIAEHRRFRDLYELWLETDHYKWRAMRANGVPERLVTGDAEPFEKFMAFAKIVPRLPGSPVYHWVHLELQRYFGITEVLSEKTAEKIWEKTREMMKGDGFDTVSLLQKMNVRVLCTTDDPADTLEYHKKIREDRSIPFRVLPSFRPDAYLSGAPAVLEEKRRKLMERFDAADLETALLRALDHFKENGALVSDHGFTVFPYGSDPEFSALLLSLGRAYKEKGMVMQLHLGPLRNNSAKLMRAFGPDAGGDSIGNGADIAALGAFLHDLEARDSLPKTILFNLNPADNAAFSTMAGNFAPSVQYGPAWWFNDTFRGITNQIDELMETNALASSVGMLTDSRSFTSFVRHEYYRRILCRRLGELADAGFYPDDVDTLGKIVRDICFGNAEKFFG